MGIAIVATFIGIYADLFSLSGVQVGLIGMAYSLIQLVVLYPIGHYADTGYRKLLLLVGLGLAVPIYLLFWQIDGFLTLFSARMLQGLVVALTSACSLSFVSIRSSEGRRGLNLGIVNSFSGAGRTAGALAGGFLVAKFGFGVPYGILAGLYAVSFFLAYFFIPAEDLESREQRAGGGLHLKELLSGSKFRIQFTFEMSFAFAKSIVIIFIPVFAYTMVGVSEAQLGGIVAARYLPLALAQGFSGGISDRVGRVPLVIGGAGLFAAAAFILPTRTTFWGLLTVSALFGLGDSIRVPASWGVFADQGIDTGPATAFSFRMLAWRPGMLAGPLLGGLVKDLVGISGTFYLAAAIVVFALGGYLVLHGYSGDSQEPRSKDGT